MMLFWILCALLVLLAVAFVALPLLRAPDWALAVLAGFMLLGGGVLRDAAFNAKGWLFLGLATKVAPSADYIPLFPWFGLVLLGMLAGRWLLGGAAGRLWHWQARDQAGPALAWAGRHSLAIYLLHQPILIGLLMALMPFFG